MHVTTWPPVRHGFSEGLQGQRWGQAGRSHTCIFGTMTKKVKALPSRRWTYCGLPTVYPRTVSEHHALHCKQF